MCLFGIILLICFYLAVLEEKRKCKHNWEETERIRGVSIGGFMVTEVHLKCKVCGDVKKATL